MYTNSKDQKSLEEAYYNVHAEVVTEAFHFNDIVNTIRGSLNKLSSLLNIRNGAVLVDTLLGNPEFRQHIEDYLVKTQNKENTVQNLVDAHNMKIGLIELAGHEFFDKLKEEVKSGIPSSTFNEKLAMIVNHFKKPLSQDGELTKNS